MRRLDVREEADLLEQLDAEALRLVDDERRGLPGGVAVREAAPRDAREGAPWTRPPRAQIELEGEQPDEVVGAKRGIIQVNAPDVAAPLGFQGRPYQRRLAGSGLANQHGQRFGRRQPVLQDAQRLALRRREEQVLGICRQLERELGQAVEVFDTSVGPPLLTADARTPTPRRRPGEQRVPAASIAQSGAVSPPDVRARSS